MRSAALTLLVFLLLASTAKASEVATPILDKTPLSKSPGAPSYKKISALTYRGDFNRFLVLESKYIENQRWLKVRLPGRPNNSSAWIRSHIMTLKRTKALFLVDLSSRKLVYFWNKQKRWKTKVEIGAAHTPTPTGLFSIYDRWSAWRYYPGASYGPWVFDLTAHSAVYKTFANGKGRIAIHGSASDLWGSANTHGCIRAPDWALEKMRRQAARGYPVRVRR